VDCTAEGESVCKDHDVSGYPTIKYFTAETGKSGKSYDGSRDFKSLKAFVEKDLGGKLVKCDIATKKDCDEEQTKVLDDFAASKLEALLEEVENLKSQRATIRQDAEEAKRKIDADMEKSAKVITKKVKILNKLAKKAMKEESPSDAKEAASSEKGAEEL